jgi:hypothetical protein
LTYKSTTQPLCRCCGKPIGKHTTTQYFGGSGAVNKIAEYPRDKAEAQRLVNQQIVSLRYHRASEGYRPQGAPDHDYVWWVGLWDGEGYRDEFFCSDPCAVRFAYAFARAGYACRAFTDAKAKARMAAL